MIEVNTLEIYQILISLVHFEKEEITLSDQKPQPRGNSRSCAIKA